RPSSITYLSATFTRRRVNGIIVLNFTSLMGEFARISGRRTAEPDDARSWRAGAKARLGPSGWRLRGRGLADTGPFRVPRCWRGIGRFARLSGDPLPHKRDPGGTG